MLNINQELQDADRLEHDKAHYPTKRPNILLEWFWAMSFQQKKTTTPHNNPTIMHYRSQFSGRNCKIQHSGKLRFLAKTFKQQSNNKHVMPVMAYLNTTIKWFSSNKPVNFRLPHLIAGMILKEVRWHTKNWEYLWIFVAHMTCCKSLDWLH